MPIVSTLLNRFKATVWSQLAKRSSSENAFLALVPVVGMATGLSAMFIAHLIAYLQRLLWGSGELMLAAAQEMPWQWRILIPAAGGVVVGAIAWRWRHNASGLGTAGIIHALALKGGVISFRQELPAVVNGIVTVVSGGSLGREGPMTEFAAAMGSYLGRRFNLSTQHLRILVCCAAASALSAVYNAPIGGSFLALELLIGSFALEVLGPVVVASVISTMIFRSCMGDLPRFDVPKYELVSGWELFGYLGLGIVAGIFSVALIRVVYAIEELFKKIPLPRFNKPAIGFALVGVIGCWYPQVFGNGFDATNLVLRQQVPLALLLLLPLAKLAATALTRGSGGSGGMFTPTLMLGALVGGAFGYGIHASFPGHTGEYGAYALVGMGGVLAGTTHAPITAIMMIFEQTNSYQIILPLMFVCIISNFTARLLMEESLHIEGLKRRGVALPRGLEQSVMQTLRVSDLMHQEVESVRASEPFASVVDWFLRSRNSNLYVVDETGRFLGAIPLYALKETLSRADSLDGVVAYDLLDADFKFVTPDQRLADTMEIFWKQPCERLPVVGNANTRRLIGWISKRDLIGVYNQEILQKRPAMGRFSMTDGEGKRDTFVELPEGFLLHTVNVPMEADGRTLRDMALPSRYNVYVLQIKRRDPRSGSDTVEMPGPDSRLAAQDRLIVVGTVVDIARLIGDMATGIENNRS